MSKKTAIILILAVFLGALAALIWFYFTSNDGPKAPIKQAVTEDIYDPFGTKTPTTDLVVSSSTELTVDNTDQGNFVATNKLRKISSDPISGYSLFTDPKDSRTYVHYILRANGNIYETYQDSVESKRLSITTVPRVYESTWLPGGQNLIIRYLKDNTENIETFSVKINPATTTLNEFEGGIDGNFLTENINSLVLNPAGDKIFYLTSNLTGASGYISKPTGLNKKLLFESPLIEWNISWPKEEIVTMTTKPAAQILGYMYFLNTQTGTFSKIIGGIRGLTTKTNSAATDVLYSDESRNIPRLYLLNIKSGESKLLPWNTFPEKCVWGNTDSKTIYCAAPKSFSAGDYPDLWYQGLTNFNDQIWKVNIDTGASTLILDLEKESENALDAIELQIDKSDSYLYFTNKTDLTFWSLDLRNN
jgi:hypothetical protein